MVNLQRIRILKDGLGRAGPVIYWMGRDQRSKDNWALLFAQQIALKKKVPLIVAFCLVPSFLDASIRQYDFMIEGLKVASAALKKRNISFHLLTGDPIHEMPKFVRKTGASVLVCDFEPLKIKTTWKQKISAKIDVPVFEVDARNIVPCFFASPKQEFGAYTLRPKIHRVLADFIESYPALKRHPHGYKAAKIDWAKAIKSLKVDFSVKPVNWIKPGEIEATRALKRFIRQRLDKYDTARNDPALQGQSDLSPYLHFGHISSLAVANEVMKSKAAKKSKEVFLEELIVRRELSDNFCFYNKNYDTFEGAPKWAKKTLKKHMKDRREYVYSVRQFESASTHDDLWNAAQKEMVQKGKMHGYMRMYWAKKILEWSRTPQEAIKTAIYLNDKYELDGRDTNGYAGIMWAVCGIHDRPWPERKIFGKVRFMSYSGCKSKFDIKKYITKASSVP